MIHRRAMDVIGSEKEIIQRITENQQHYKNWQTKKIKKTRTITKTFEDFTSS